MGCLWIKAPSTLEFAVILLPSRTGGRQRCDRSHSAQVPVEITRGLRHTRAHASPRHFEADFLLLDHALARRGESGRRACPSKRP